MELDELIERVFGKPEFLKQITDKRVNWDDYGILLATVISLRSTCLRRPTGAVLLDENNRIIATGYNGAPPKLPHCDELGGCLRQKLKVPSGKMHELCRGIHAEENCILTAARGGKPTVGAKLFTTNFPCSICARHIIGAGIKEVVHLTSYEDEVSKKLLEQAGIKVRKYEPTSEYAHRLLEGIVKNVFEYRRTLSKNFDIKK